MCVAACAHTSHLSSLAATSPPPLRLAYEYGMRSILANVYEANVRATFTLEY